MTQKGDFDNDGDEDVIIINCNGDVYILENLRINNNRP